MDDLNRTRELLNSHLDTLLESDALGALAAIGAVQRDLTQRQQQAVRAAATEHTWAEIGEALGVSKQAAHQRFAKEWAKSLKAELKAEHRAMKSAQREGNAELAERARARRDALITEFKTAVRQRAVDRRR
jgi:hypothetical protein